MGEVRKRLVERASVKAATLLVAGGLAVTACGKGRGDTDAGSTVAADTTAMSSTQQDRPLQINEVEIKHDWSKLPAPIQLTPSIMTEAGCYNDFWLDESGKRAPLVQADPPVVTTDGRCNTPLNSPVNGIYFEPAQVGPAPIKTNNGDSLGVECWTPGQVIQDIRGPHSASDVWLAVVNADGQAGFFPKVNAGFFDETAVPQC
jgi:hypothetical protein